MTSLLSKLLGRKKAAPPQHSFADLIRRNMMAPLKEGAKDRLFEKRIAAFGDDDVVRVYAGDIRIALQAARESIEPHPDRFRLEYDWNSGRLISTDGRAHIGAVSDGGLMAVAGFVLGRVRQDDLTAPMRPRRQTASTVGIDIGRDGLTSETVDWRTPPCSM